MRTRPTRSLVIDRGDTSNIDQCFLENLTRVIGSRMGAILQTQHRQQQPTVTPSVQEGRRELYSDWALAALMGYAQVYTETGIPIIWG